MTIDIFSVSDKKALDILYVQLNSIKHMKASGTIISYYYFIEDVTNEDKEYFSDLISPDFNIQFIDARKYEKQINAPQKTYLYYLRCLAPTIFNNLNKILYFDNDVIVVSNRLEELWNTDIKDVYLAGAIDIEESLRDENERVNVGKNVPNNTYFNSGVLLLNLEKIRKDGYDKKIHQYLLNYPEELQCILYDQTLFNWLFKDNVKIISTDFNNSILSMRSYDEKYYQEYYKTKNLYNEVKKACILHFKGDKVWNLYSKQRKKLLPYYNLGRMFYLSLYTKYAKR